MQFSALALLLMGGKAAALHHRFGVQRADQDKMQIIQRMRLLRGGADAESMPNVPVYEPLPKFDWGNVRYQANFHPTVRLLVPITPILAYLTRSHCLGGRFSVGMSELGLGAALSIPVLVLSMLLALTPIGNSLIPEACAILCSMGARFCPLRAVGASMLIAAPRAIGGALLLQGVLQTTFKRVFTSFIPTQWAVILSVGAQALIAGFIDPSSATEADMILPTVISLSYGVAFATTSNLAVPFMMQLVTEFVGTYACHMQLACATEERQRAVLSLGGAQFRDRTKRA
mmetsp:Transcript_41883/g.84053  ORF Transcript_41883/g.84053 Transcript_41883/m.84053 type:complete len:287 (-) Transcript_41883:581-1441(-)